MSGPRALVILGLAAIAVAAVAGEGRADPAIELEPITAGLLSPVDVQHAGDGSGRLFIVERAGRIRILSEAGALLTTPFLDIQTRVMCCNERGLLGLAFHPDYEANGLFYVNYTVEDPDPVKLPGAANGDTVVARYQVSASDANLADPDSEQIVLTIAQPFANHNGGQLQFGPDGYLYIATGDGGSGGDPGDRGQNLGTLLGKILRIDVDTASPYAVPPDNPFVGVAAARDEIWAYGLRNPWRFSFDRATGDVFIADVGQNAWEEVSFQAASSSGGENYGWRCREGAHDFNTTGCGGKTFVEPILEYSHAEGCSVTGGFRYRGYAAPPLLGIYLYGDFCSGLIWGASFDGSAWQTVELLASNLLISTFGEDELGEIYVADLSGELYRITTKLTDELAVDLGTGGLWHFEAGSWTDLTSSNPTALERWSNELAVVFGPDEGLWLRESASWRGLTSWTPYAIAAWHDALVASFDAGRGLWLYRDSGWRQITTWEPELVVPWGELVAVDFGDGRGLWLYDGASWSNIAGWSPERLVAHGPHLVAAFGAGRGLWRYGSGRWAQIAGWDPYDVVAWNEKLVAAFDGGRGTFVHDGTTWAELTTLEPSAMTPMRERLVVALGAGNGLWTFSDAGWSSLTIWDPVRLGTIVSDIVVDFGDGRGLWIHDAAGWRQITPWSSEELEMVDLF